MSRNLGLLSAGMVIGVVTLAVKSSFAASVVLSPVSYVGSVSTSAAGVSDEKNSQTGPDLALTSSSAAIPQGSLSPGGPWPGPLTSADAQTSVNAGIHNGILIGTSDADAPSQPVPNLPDTDFSYAASASSSADGLLSYDLYITGPEPTVGVLVQASALVTGSGSEDRTLMQVLSYTFTIGGILNDTLGISYGYGITDKLAVAGTGHYYVEGSPSDGITGGSIEDSVYTFSTNHLYQIDMNFSLSSHAGTATMGNNDNSSILLGGKIQGSVIIDPSYEIALGTPDADAYTIHLSPGVAVGAPESSTWSMMLLGLGSLGLVGRLSIRKKRAR